LAFCLWPNYLNNPGKSLRDDNPGA
jgi:hypothetical protein